MKTIKDILKADNYEQRRRIANNLAISREDKNALIANESSGSATKSKIHYYRFDSNAVAEELTSLAYEEDMIVAIISMYCITANAYIYSDRGNDVRGVYYKGHTPIIQDIYSAYRIKGLLVTKDIYFGEYPYITTGDLYTKINYYIKYIAAQSPEEAESFKTILGICLKHTTEITEDEFFGMCELPITPLPE